MSIAKPSLPETPEQKRELATRIAQLLVAQHNFVVDQMRAAHMEDTRAAADKSATAILSLMDTVTRLYPNGPERLHDDICGVVSLVGGKVIGLIKPEGSGRVH